MVALEFTIHKLNLSHYTLKYYYPLCIQYKTLKTIHFHFPKYEKEAFTVTFMLLSLALYFFRYSLISLWHVEPSFLPKIYSFAYCRPGLLALDFLSFCLKNFSATLICDVHIQSASDLSFKYLEIWSEDFSAFLPFLLLCQQNFFLYL